MSITVGLRFPLSQAAQTFAEPQNRPMIVAHYMPWFEADPLRHKWGWHWTMNAFNPERQTDGKREIAARYYPLIGPYDSGDPNVIEYHFLLMNLAGIDGIIIDWYGLSDYVDYPLLHRNSQRLFTTATRMGLKVGICYEDQTVSHLVEAKRLAPKDRVPHVQREMEWLRTHWFSKPGYLRVKGKPVLLSFGSDGLTDPEWEQVFPPAQNQILYLCEHRRRTAAGGAFDWPQPDSGVAGVETFYQSVSPSGEKRYLAVPVVFPRFHDIYKAGKAGAGYAEIPDNQGHTFSITLERAVHSNLPLIQIATWNDWGEGTIIEPSREYGYRDLETLQKFRRTRDPRFAAAPADLRLPCRLWQLRGTEQRNSARTPALDAIAERLVSGNIAGARSLLNKFSPSPAVRVR